MDRKSFPQIVIECRSESPQELASSINNVPAEKRQLAVAVAVPKTLDRLTPSMHYISHSGGKLRCASISPKPTIQWTPNTSPGGTSSPGISESYITRAQLHSSTGESSNDASFSFLPIVGCGNLRSISPMNFTGSCNLRTSCSRQSKDRRSNSQPSACSSNSCLIKDAEYLANSNQRRSNWIISETNEYQDEVNEEAFSHGSSSFGFMHSNLHKRCLCQKRSKSCDNIHLMQRKIRKCSLPLKRKESIQVGFMKKKRSAPTRKLSRRMSTCTRRDSGSVKFSSSYFGVIEMPQYEHSMTERLNLFNSGLDDAKPTASGTEEPKLKRKNLLLHNEIYEIHKNRPSAGVCTMRMRTLLVAMQVLIGFAMSALGFYVWHNISELFWDESTQHAAIPVSPALNCSRDRSLCLQMLLLACSIITGGLCLVCSLGVGRLSEKISKCNSDDRMEKENCTDSCVSLQNSSFSCECRLSKNRTLQFLPKCMFVQHNLRDYLIMQCALLAVASVVCLTQVYNISKKIYKISQLNQKESPVNSALLDTIQMLPSASCDIEAEGESIVSALQSRSRHLSLDCSYMDEVKKISDSTVPEIRRLSGPPR
ncbi:hypothetical protein Ciccas_007884 [Cichlidogyrus casuarinus]|uniref:Uncharacterized protein n=1 Tax=Cichlidogyrus casuarinus TaxID=1844966 RepID=A0ABD2Q2B9_9PLAT